MHQLFSPRPSSPLQRALTLLLALCVLCAGASIAASGARADQSACANAASEVEACAAHDENSADKRPHFDLDKLSGQADVPVSRAFRRWFSAALASDCGAGSAAWLLAPAHDPPKTILFCTLLI